MNRDFTLHLAAITNSVKSILILALGTTMIAGCDKADQSQNVIDSRKEDRKEIDSKIDIETVNLSSMSVDELLDFAKRNDELRAFSPNLEKALRGIFLDSRDNYSSLVDRIFADRELRRRFKVISYLAVAEDQDYAKHLIDKHLAGPERMDAYSNLASHYEFKGDLVQLWDLVQTAPAGEMSTSVQRPFFRACARIGAWDLIEERLRELPYFDGIREVGGAINEGARISGMAVPPATRQTLALIIEEQRALLTKKSATGQVRVKRDDE